MKRDGQITIRLTSEVKAIHLDHIPEDHARRGKLEMTHKVR